MGEAFIKRRKIAPPDYIMLDPTEGPKNGFSITAYLGSAAYLSYYHAYMLYSSQQGGTFNATTTRFDVKKYKRLHISGYMNQTQLNNGFVHFNLCDASGNIISSRAFFHSDITINHNFSLSNIAANKNPLYLVIYSQASYNEAPNLFLTDIKLTQ